MTGIYLFGHNSEGKRTPVEIEHLSVDERYNDFSNRDAEDSLRFVHVLCDNIIEIDFFLIDEGYDPKVIFADTFLSLNVELNVQTTNTNDQREKFFDGNNEAIIDFMNLLCDRLVKTETFLKNEGFERVEPPEII